MPSFKPIIVESYATLFSCTAMTPGDSGLRLNNGFDVKLYEVG